MTGKAVGKIVREATVLATERMQELGMPPLPHITPHSFRRTYISILLLASEFDLEWVKKQVGHADSKMTLEVYNQLQQRVKREHGAAFDRLIREARQRLHASQEPPPGASTPDTGGVCAEVCVEPAKTPTKPRPPRRPGRGQNLAISRKNGGSRRRDSAAGHICFQSCALPTELSRHGSLILAPQRPSGVCLKAGYGHAATEGESPRNTRGLWSVSHSRSLRKTMTICKSKKQWGRSREKRPLRAGLKPPARR
jgi:hypothetical protein